MREGPRDVKVEKQKCRVCDGKGTVSGTTCSKCQGTGKAS